MLQAYRWFVVLLAVGGLTGCIGLRNPLPPDTSPVDVPPAEGTITLTFADMITEAPINYEVELLNPGGRFEWEMFQMSAAANGLDITGVATLHFKPEEPLNVYVRRFFNNQAVTDFEPVPETDVLRANGNERYYYAHPVVVDGRKGWVMLEFRGSERVQLARYEAWFVAMAASAQATRSEG